MDKKEKNFAVLYSAFLFSAENLSLSHDLNEP